MNHIVGCKQGECSKFGSSFENLRNFSRTCHPLGFDNFKHFSFLIQEKILLEFKMHLQLARIQGGLIHGL